MGIHQNEEERLFAFLLSHLPPDIYKEAADRATAYGRRCARLGGNEHKWRLISRMQDFLDAEKLECYPPIAETNLPPSGGTVR